MCTSAIAVGCFTRTMTTGDLEIVDGGDGGENIEGRIAVFGTRSSGHQGVKLLDFSCTSKA